MMLPEASRSYPYIQIVNSTKIINSDNFLPLSPSKFLARISNSSYSSCDHQIRYIPKILGKLSRAHLNGQTFQIFENTVQNSEFVRSAEKISPARPRIRT